MMVADHRRDDTHGAIITRLLAAAPERFAVCGLSMGGTLASELTRRVPERVKRLAVRDVTAKRATANKNAVRIEMIAHAECGRQDHRLPLLWSSVVAPARLQDKELQAFVRRMAMNTGPEAFIGHQRALLDRPASRQGLAMNCVPMLVPVGSKDHLTPVGDWQEIAAGIAGSKLMDVPGCGDLWTLQAPDLVTAALPAWTEA